MIEKTWFSINKKEMWIGGLASPNPSLPRASLQLKIRCRFALILFLYVRPPAQTSLAGFLHTKIRWSCLTILFSVVEEGGLASPNPSLSRASLQLKIRCRFALILFLCVRSPAQTSLAGSLQTKIRWSCLTILFSVVEEGGFEPPVRLHVRQFSKLLVSATHPSFQTLADLRKQSVCFPKRVQR